MNTPVTSTLPGFHPHVSPIQQQQSSRLEQTAETEIHYSSEEQVREIRGRSHHKLGSSPGHSKLTCGADSKAKTRSIKAVAVRDP